MAKELNRTAVAATRVQAARESLALVHGALAGSDPRGALMFFRDALVDTETALVHVVGVYRSSGASWAEIGSALGMSKQAAWQRFGRHDSK